MSSIRNHIIHKSSPIFLKNAFAGSSLRMILAESNIVKGSLYHHFPMGKAGIALESPQWLLDSVWNPLLTELARARKSEIPNIIYAFVSNEVITNDQVIFPSYLAIGLQAEHWKIRAAIEDFYLELESKFDIIFKSKKIRSSSNEVSQFLLEAEILCLRYHNLQKRDSFLNPLLKVCKKLL